MKPNETLPPIPENWHTLINSLTKRIEHLSKRQDLPFEALKEVVSITCEVRKLQAQAQSVLPGFEVAAGKKPFKRPTIEEVQLYCSKAGVCKQDADWFWYKMEGQGWKVNDKKMESWERTIIAWKLAHYLPSMKGQLNGNYRTNGTGSTDNRSLLAKEIDRQSAIIDREYGARRLSNG